MLFRSTVITYDPEVARAAVEPIVILTPSSFPYESDKAVPWNYEAKVMNPAKTEPVANIAGVGGMTRSGRCYTPEELERRRGTLVGEDIVEGTHRKEPVTDAEVAEFKKVVKRSEFNIVEQLNRTPAQISLLSLQLSSESHRDAILKVLNEAHVPQDTPVERVETLVGAVLASNYIAFTDDEIPPDGTGHTRALHITTKCKEMIVARF